MIAHQVLVLAARAGDDDRAVVVPLLGYAMSRPLTALLAGEDHGVTGHLRGRSGGIVLSQLAEQLGVGARDAGGVRRCRTCGRRMRQGWRWMGGMQVAVIAEAVGRGGGRVVRPSEGEASGEEARIS
jgi:hypothetical protein